MRLAFVILALSFSASSFAQQAYHLQFRIDGWQDTTVYLAHYYGESTYLRDTAQVNNRGEFSFDGKKPLVRGIYFLVLNKTKVPFEIVIGSNQHFSMETDAADYIKNMVVKGDLDNKLSFENMIFNMERHQEAAPHISVIQDSTLQEINKKEARAAFAKINETVLAHQQELIEQYPNTLTATILKANQAVKIPDPPKRPDGSIDSTFQLRWYREHFFDNFDLAEDALLRMPRPLYSEKINEYLDKLFAPQADSVTQAIDKLMMKAKKNPETFRYALYALLQKYQQPEIMGLDAVFVNLYDRYIVTGESDYWVNASMKKNLKEYAERLRKSLIGKTAPNLMMQDQNLKPRSMYDLKNKYTIVYIFDPDCGHCKKETPKLASFYEKNKARFDVEVFAVCTDSSMVKMKSYMKEVNMKWITVNGPRTYVGSYHDLYDALTTPALFILDDKKKIIGKKIPADKLEDFFVNYERFMKKTPAKAPANSSGKL
ncbi:MAG TPA: redoxin domain-containing protein [Ohtaekwangia sp.]|nr:redoxin domain-containing protein [Ohtaekwangia sp.]